MISSENKTVSQVRVAPPGLSSHRPRILLLTQLFFPELISTGQTLTELAEELARMGTDIEVVCGPPTILGDKSKVQKYLEHEGIKIRRVWGTRLSKLSFVGKFANQVTFFLGAVYRILLDSSRRPILAVTNPPFQGPLCVLARLLKKRPFIYLMFDVYPDTAIRAGIIKGGGLIAQMWDRSNLATLRHASAVVVLGCAMRRVIMEKGKELTGLEDKLRVIPVWSDDRIIKPIQRADNPFIQKWHLGGKVVVGYSGNMGRFHDLETIMKAAKQLAAYKEIVFLFVGEGYKKRWMIEYAQANRLENCAFHAHVPRNELAFSINCSDIGLVSLAKAQEGLSEPSKAFGIMAAGIPVVGVLPEASEIARIIEDDECGLRVNPGDVDGLAEAILRFYRNPEHRRKAGGKGLNVIRQKYSIKYAAQKYFLLINSLQKGEKKV